VKNPRDVIIAPVVSEKAFDQMEAFNTYTFLVDRRVNKTEIKQAIQAIFDVEVTSVRTVNRKGKWKRTGWVVGRRKNTKRALVTLAPEDNIDIYAV